jgi:hypothetical protein
MGQQLVSPAEGGGGQLPDIPQQMMGFWLNPPTATSSWSFRRPARVSRLRLRRFVFFFMRPPFVDHGPESQRV